MALVVTALAVEKSVGWTKAAIQKTQGCYGCYRACRHKIIKLKLSGYVPVDEHSEISIQILVTLLLFGRALHPMNTALSPLQSLCIADICI